MVAQTSYSTGSGLSNHEIGSRYNQGLRSDADDPQRPLPYMQPARQGRDAFVNKLFDVFQDRRLINSALAKLRPTKLMHQSRIENFAPEPSKVSEQPDRAGSSWDQVQNPSYARLQTFASTASVIAGIELRHRIHKHQFALSWQRPKGSPVPAIWNAELAA